VRVAAAQIVVTMGDKDANLRAARAAVAAAAQQRCDVVVLPECLLAGWLSPAAPELAEPIPGPATDLLAELATTHGLAIVAGIEERAPEGLYNAAALVDRHGRLLARHRKVDELDEGLQLYRRGSSLGVVELEGVLVAVTICADSWAPAITDTVHLMDARLVLSPCAWAVAPGGEETNLAWIAARYAERTAGRELFVVAADGVGVVSDGPWRGKVLQGDSLVVGPDGVVLGRGRTGEPDLVVVDLPL